MEKRGPVQQWGSTWVTARVPILPLALVGRGGYELNNSSLKIL